MAHSASQKEATSVSLASLSSTKNKKNISSSVTIDCPRFKRQKTSSFAASPVIADRPHFKRQKTSYVASSVTADGPHFKRQKTSSSAATSMPTTAWGRWGGGLPDDILSLILRKLILQDHLRFSCVCVSWNLAVRGGRLGLRLSPKPQLPWIMIAGAGQDRTSAKFISPSEHRTYDIPLPYPPIQERLCVGSSHGWLITLHNFSEMHLLNPITGIQVPLPAIDTTIPTTTTYPSGYHVHSSPRHGWIFFGKAILSSAPSRDGTGGFTIFLIRGMPKKPRSLAITRIGDDAWTTFADEYIVDIIYHKGRLHCMGVRGDIHIWEQQQHDHHLSFVPRFTIDARDFRHCNIPLELTYAKTIYLMGKYLVQSMTGELFMLIKTGRKLRDGTRFQIIRLDLDRNEYVPVDDLKDLVFFVGINESIIVSATEFPEVKCNSVYFAKGSGFTRTDFKFRVQPSWNVGKFDVPPGICPGVFDVKKKESVELLDNIGSHLSWKEKKHIGSLLNRPPPIWITPTLF